jgi:ribosome recycling factor
MNTDPMSKEGPERDDYIRKVTGVIEQERVAIRQERRDEFAAKLKDDKDRPPVLIGATGFGSGTSSV